MSLQVSRREFLGSFLGAALATTLGSCAPALVGSAPTSQSTATSAALPAANPAARQGGTLRFGKVGDFQSLEPQASRPDGSLDHLYDVWDQLITVDANRQVQPMLAESWDIANNHQQIKFSLRPGVQFHTGRELTADDVKFSLLRIQDPKISSSLTGRMAPMTSVDTPDKYTVIVNASRPWVEAFDVLNQATIIDPITFQSDELSKPTGTGPFRFVEYTPGDHLRLSKNQNYWRTGLPYVDEVLVSIHTDAQAATVALESGALDVMSVGVPITDVLRLQTDPKYQVLINDQSGNSWDLVQNCTRAPTDNKLVRQALNYALDRKRMADTVWHGLQNPLVLPWNPSSPSYDATKNQAYAFDLDTARSLLAQAGITSANFDITWQAGPPEPGVMAQIYQADLARIGITTTLKPMESAAWVQAIYNAGYQGVAFGIFGLGNLNPASGVTGQTYGPQSNFGGFKDDAYTQLINQVLTETDPAKQHQLYSQLNDYYLDQAWTLDIVPNPEHAVARSNVHGLRYDNRTGLVIGEIWLQ
jgi:peptide/nickel transport system substrate-binding protein